MALSVISTSLRVSGLKFEKLGPPCVDQSGRACIMMGDVFFHGTSDEFAAFMEGMSTALAMAFPEYGQEPKPACPECGSTEGTPKDWDAGIDPETGYHDAGTGCTECVK